MCEHDGYNYWAHLRILLIISMCYTAVLTRRLENCCGPID